MSYKSISISFQNINGLFERVGKARSCKLLNSSCTSPFKSDIICLVKTHHLASEYVFMQGYKCILNCRPKVSKKLSGGLAILVKENYKPGHKFEPRTCSKFYWFKLCKSFFGMAKDIFVFVVYAAPRNSHYSKTFLSDFNIFDQLEKDISIYSQLGSVMLGDDCNGRVNTSDLDYIDHDCTSNVDLPTDYFPYNVSLYRNSRDQSTTDEHGKMILDLCHSAQLRILNGRTLGDSRGDFTCYMYRYNGSSVVDWRLVDHNLPDSVVFFSCWEFVSFVGSLPALYVAQGGLFTYSFSTGGSTTFSYWP